MNTVIRATRSVCPVCLKNLPALLRRETDGRVILEKTCEVHGTFRTPVWSGEMDFNKWQAGSDQLAPEAGLSCPDNCGLCPEHESASCCVLLEVTRRCNLRCCFCFADGGSAGVDPSAESLQAAISDIVLRQGPVLLQLSGGEPTLRDDLPQLVRFAKETGCSCVQLNTNGLRLAREPDYAARLAEAGLDIVFLQFDGTKDEIYESLRGEPLLEQKLEAIRVCSQLRLGVTLVPTVVPCVNDDDLGALVALAGSLAPGVRGVHFQPVSYIGRYPAEADGRRTLDRLMAELSRQTGIPTECFLPSRCDHPLCGFHAKFLIEPSGALKPLYTIEQAECCRGTAQVNRDYVARSWTRPAAEPAPKCGCGTESSLDTFLYRLRHQSITLSAMVFQDAMNLNIERLHRCTLHVYQDGRIRPFCAHYLTPASHPRSASAE